MCAELIETHGEEPNEYIKTVMKGLEKVSKKDMSDTELMAVHVSTLLILLLTNIIAKSKSTTKLECAMRVNAYKLD
jgi:hypothetical protein